jgi:ribosomal protein L21E
MPVLVVEQVPALIATGASTRVDAEATARFNVGDLVTALNINPVTHTRLPRYVRGKTGTVVLAHGVFSFNDTNAHSLGHKPQHVYTVSFAARELWGPRASAYDTLRIDMFDDYLEPAPSPN